MPTFHNANHFYRCPYILAQVPRNKQKSQRMAKEVNRVKRLKRRPITQDAPSSFEPRQVNILHIFLQQGDGLNTMDYSQFS